MQGKARNFNKISTHFRADLDEEVAISILQNFGKAVFPGVESATISFLQSEPAFANPTTVYVGIGGARLGEFDEHRPEGRLQNTCAAVLVAQRLGVCEKRGVKDLLHETLLGDTQQRTQPIQLGNLLKMMHRIKSGNDQLRTHLWVTDAIEAIMFSRTLDEDYDIRVAWKNFREDDGVPVIKSLEDFIAKAHECRKTFVTGLGMICALMDPKMRQRWLQVTFRMLVKDAAMFEEAISEINTKSETFEVLTLGSSYMVTMIQTDNESVGRASSSVRTGKAAITVIRNSRGHTQILSDHKIGLDMRWLKMMIRLAEYRAVTKKPLSEERAWGEGQISECPAWFYPNPNTLLNGSFTHPQVVRSKLTLEEIKEILKSAFHPRKHDEWVQKYYESKKPTIVIDLEREIAR